jgi:hypothetical protein
LYLEKWSNNVVPLDTFHWTLLKNPATWEKILRSTKCTANVDKNITKILYEDGFFDEFIHIANISKTRTDEWNTKPPTNLKGGLKYQSLCEVNVFC